VDKPNAFEIATCTECERLLKECQEAREMLHWRREQVRKTRLTGVGVGRELLALQARFAKAYNDLRNHVQECEPCRSRATAWNHRTLGQFPFTFFQQVPA
jgi:hypothetical protein